MNHKKLYKPCVNCGINTNRLRKRLVSEGDENFRQLLSDWTCKEFSYPAHLPPQGSNFDFFNTVDFSKLEDDDLLCNNCYLLVQESLETKDTSRKFGFKSVCLSCGASILHLHPRDITETKPVLAQWVQPHQVKRLNHVCRACWERANRAVKKQKYSLDMKKNHQANNDTLTEPDDPLEEQEVYAPSPSSPVDEKPLIHTPSSPIDEKPLFDEKLLRMSPKPNVPTITLNTYRRASNSPNRCIFKYCELPERLPVPALLKERLLIDYSFYVPNGARICEAHLFNIHKEWRNLYDEHSNSEFNAVQIEDLCSLLKNSAERYYSNDSFQSIIKRKDFLCKYWLGVDYSEFKDMLDAIAPVRDKIRFPIKSVAMYLIKRHLGFTDEKLAACFKISVALMNKSFGIMHQYLENKVDFVVCDGLPIVNCKEEKDSLRI